ncbi:MAG TPA: enolase C-terminal domain-like protein [Pirellulales bacterium]|nr:enolase C-terminal domain-like protein [Pirellulales bacterium]HVA50759.1 enolase C-terminal domain-like protein [Pirellulales bacterium]
MSGQLARVRCEAPITSVEATAYAIPTDRPESDGTYQWDKTVLVLVEAQAGGERGLGYTYADASTATLIRDKLNGIVAGIDAFRVPEAWHAMVHAIRNLGRPGIAAMAISAVDNALWDLKARLLGLPLVLLLGAARDAVPVYGSGGFTSYSDDELRRQLAGWVELGVRQVKMKIGRDAAADRRRVTAARQAIGDAPELYVDANGAYSRKQALAQAEAFVDEGVSWFEEPVSSDDLEGLRLLRGRAPAGMDIAAGEYGYDLVYFQRMLSAGAVDVLQIDATRAGGITGFLQAAALAAAFQLDVSAHCAPLLHAHPCCALSNIRPLEYFHDHVRIEHLLFDGALSPAAGQLCPDLTRPGTGVEFKHADAKKFAIGGVR